MTSKPFLEWEDWRAGMYTPSNDPARITDTAQLLRDAIRFRDAARAMLTDWPNAAYHNLRLLMTGQEAWIGHATCCHALAATRSETCVGWGTLTNAEQRVANIVARSVIHDWELGHAETLFVD